MGQTIERGRKLGIDEYIGQGFGADQYQILPFEEAGVIILSACSQSAQIGVNGDDVLVCFAFVHFGKIKAHGIVAKGFLRRNGNKLLHLLCGLRSVDRLGCNGRKGVQIVKGIRCIIPKEHILFAQTESGQKAEGIAGTGDFKIGFVAVGIASNGQRELAHRPAQEGDYDQLKCKDPADADDKAVPPAPNRHDPVQHQRKEEQQDYGQTGEYARKEIAAVIAHNAGDVSKDGAQGEIYLEFLADQALYDKQKRD